jgi:hypothetical protein
MKFHRLIEWWDGKNLMHVSATDEHSREAAFKEALEGAIESGWYPPKWWDISRWYEGFGGTGLPRSAKPHAPRCVVHDTKQAHDSLCRRHLHGGDRDCWLCHPAPVSHGVHVTRDDGVALALVLGLIAFAVVVAWLLPEILG